MPALFHIVARTGRVAPLLAALWLAGCSDTPPEFELPGYHPTEAASGAMSQYDANGDGQIEGPELEKSPGLKAALVRCDLDKNGALSESEIRARVQEYAHSGISLVGLECSFRHNGAPLAEAEIEFIPESFLGAAVKPGKGKTDTGGTMFPLVEGHETRGLYYGMYRIRVSKKDSSGRETIPARYNEQTTLGQELGPGVDLEHGLRFELTGK